MGASNLFLCNFWCVFISIVPFLVKREKAFVYYLLLFRNGGHNFIFRLPRFRRDLELILLAKISWNDVIKRVGINMHWEYLWEGIADGSISIFTFKFTQFNQIVKSRSLNFPKNCMFLVQPGTSVYCHKKLTLIGVGCGLVSHGHNTSVRKLQSLMELIKKAATVDALPSFASPCRVSTLNHKAFDDSMKQRAVIVAFEAELKEVATSSWRLLCPQLNLNVSIVCF